MQITLSIPEEPDFPDIIFSSTGPVIIPNVGDKFKFPRMKASVTVRSREFIYDDRDNVTVWLNPR